MSFLKTLYINHSVVENGNNKQTKLVLRQVLRQVSFRTNVTVSTNWVPNTRFNICNLIEDVVYANYAK